MKKYLPVLLIATASAGALAQDSYWGGDLPGLYALAYTQPDASSVGLRAQFAQGVTFGNSGVLPGLNLAGGLKASRLGVFADWYPQGSGFRLVGGLSLNDIRADFNGLGAGSAPFNGKSVYLGGESFNLSVKFPDATPYLGIGYGQLKSDARGLGFYADLGVTIGTFNTSINSSLLGKQGITQADVDAQSFRLRDSLGGLWALPSASIGLLYRY